MFCQEINHYVDCILNGTECISPACDGVEMMKILNAIYESAKTGHEVILKKLEENSTVNVDGEDIDLNRLPLQIRRLLLSGILDKKEEE